MRLPSTAPQTGAEVEEPRSSRPPPAHVFEIGTLVSGVYEIRRLLGEGGMGQVYEAQDRRLNRRVAVKVLLPHIDPASLQSEGQGLAAIRHPSVVTVHALGIHDGIPYLVLEHVAGVSLDVYAEQRQRSGDPLSNKEILDLLIKVTEGIVEIHKAGISHRDIKPANLMLAPGSRVVLMDFGLVLPEISVRKNKVVAGSLGYMAPEVLTGNVTPGSGPLADLYSLGVVAFELFSGSLPYEAKTPAALLHRQLSESPPDLTKLCPSVPPALKGLTAKLLAPEPRDRPDDAETVLWQLRGIRERLAGTQPESVTFSALIVDDDPEIWEPLSLIVREVFPDAEIETVTNGKEALRAIRRRTPKLVLLDIGLPDINGIELAMYVRGLRLGERCALISVSGRASPSDIQLLKQLDVTFVGKGPRLREMLSAQLKKLRPARTQR